MQSSHENRKEKDDCLLNNNLIYKVKLVSCSIFPKGLKHQSKAANNVPKNQIVFNSYKFKE